MDPGSKACPCVRLTAAPRADSRHWVRKSAVLFGGVRAPSTLGSFLLAFTWGNVLQLQKVHREVLAGPARRAALPPSADALAFPRSRLAAKRVYGRGLRFTKIQGKGLLVRGLNVLAATMCTPLADPVIAVTSLHGGNASSARSADSMISGAVARARAPGCTGTLGEADGSAFYGAPATCAVLDGRVRDGRIGRLLRRRACLFAGRVPPRRPGWFRTSRF